MVARSLREQGRFRGVLENYRRSGEPYLCEIDVRAIVDRTGRPEAFIAFEREVVRRRGRPPHDAAGRYRPSRRDTRVLRHGCLGGEGETD